MTIDRIQIDFQCCGSSGPEDWYTVPWQQDKYLRDIASTRYEGKHRCWSIYSKCSCKRLS